MPLLKRIGVASLALISASVIGACGGGTDSPEKSDEGQSSAQATTSAVSTTADRADEPDQDEAEIRALVERYVAAYKAQDWESVCDALAPSVKAQMSAALAALAGSEVSCPDGFEELAKTDPSVPSVEIKRITVTGDTAVAPEADTTDGTSDLRFERVDGRWFVSADDDTSSDTGDALHEQVKSWPGKWCKLEPGATQREVRAQMGKPTETYDGQDSWSGYGTSLTAFYDADLRAYQLQANKGPLPCGRTRKAAERE